MSSPLKAIRLFCLECQGASLKAVGTCADARCPLWPWRPLALPGEECLAQADRGDRQALRAIRRQCMGCAGDRVEVRACAAREDCALWRCRFGVRPQTYKAVRRRFFAPRVLRLI